MAPPPAAQKSQRRRDRLLRLLGGLTLLAPLGGCTLGRELPNIVYVAIGANKDQLINAELKQALQEQLMKVGARFRQIHPDTHFQFGVYPEDQMVEVMRRRSRSGLVPDLLIVNGDTALRLRQAGLVDPFPIRKDQLAIFNDEELRRLRSPDGRLAGLPVLVQTQLSCFNRQRLSEPPATLQELLNASANGHPMGLSLDLYYLFWIVGSTGSLPAIDRAVLGQQLNPADRQAMTDWLAWLQNASNQQRVTFFPDQPTAEAEFKAGRIDWIPCRSTVLPQLRRVMGSALGVAPLPDGEGHRASPINRLRVLALGRSSSAAGRRRALTFSFYSVNPLTQRTLTLGSQTVLPANRFVTVPVQSSQVLAAMVAASNQGLQANSLVTLVHTNDPRIPRLQTLLTELVFGESSPEDASTELVQILQARP
ncbi:extracellular solute-binding protein [Cyanobium sp. Maggiore-St4-Cus]|uniref:extracellular solute-binding protein n=1 Tax=Cyanobium sp. Maggiore-St4-Cus TaxID=2823717 RepID=UPI0020CC5673|nr:extracellular solute-binding protein [Cyanobium sp. Maggiore-St4-Cus]MCP9788351.1 extracellular solute-binding protein [Cyanobium sp. Maggiore-St4-Cus]